MFISRTILSSRRISTQDWRIRSNSIIRNQKEFRRAVKVGCKINSPKAREWKDVVPTSTLKPKPKPQQKVYYNHTSFSDSFKQTIDTYKRKGYVVTLNYLKQLFKKNKINMQTKNNLVNTLTTIHMMNRKTRKRYLNGYVR